MLNFSFSFTLNVALRGGKKGKLVIQQVLTFVALFFVLEDYRKVSLKKFSILVAVNNVI